MIKFTPEIWIILGFVLILLEFVVPGALIVFMGTASIIVGLLIYIGLPIDHGIPFFAFMILAIGQIVFLRKRVKSWFTGDTAKDSQDSIEEFIGKPAEVVSGFEDGAETGTVVFKGANWKAVSKDPLSPGEKVVIEKQEGITLIVKKE